MSLHTAKDKKVNFQELVDYEATMYDHIGALVRGFGLGRGRCGETDRIVQSLKPVACGRSAMVT